jgi:hypothetical protein
MSLSILSMQTVDPEKTFVDVALAALRGNLTFIVNEQAKIDDNRIEVCLRKDDRKKTGEYEYFLMDIISIKEQIDSNGPGLLNFIHNGEKYYMVAGTDNTPSIVCYYFSWAYLTINPLHKIAIYDKCIFGFEEINKIENKTGYIEDWAKLINH